MALLWMDGFDWAPATTALSDGSYAQEMLWSRYDRARNETSYMTFQDGRESEGQCIRIERDDFFEKNTGSTDDTIIVGFDLMVEDTTVNHGSWFIAFYTDFSAGFNIRQRNGEWQIRRGGSTLETISSPVSDTTWAHVEIKVTVGNSGSYEVRVNGVDVASDTGVDTQPGSSSYVYSVQIDGGSQARYFQFDNYYILDSTGSKNNDFLGRQKINTLVPSSAGNSSDWTPSAGDNYQNVDEAGIDEDTTYNESSTTDDVDLYACGSGTYDTIAGVQLNTVVRNTGTGQQGFHPMVRSGGTDYEQTEQFTYQEYFNHITLMDDDPDTATTWTQSGVNSAEFGVKVG